MVKYTKEFEFASKGPKLVRGYMRGGASCGYSKGGAAKKSMPPVLAVAIGKKSDAKMPVKKAMGGSMKMTDAERAAMAKASLAKAPTRAQYDAMMTKRKAAMTPMITPVQRRAMNNETMIGRKKGGMVKC